MNQIFPRGFVDPGKDLKSLLVFLVFGTFILTLAADALSDLILNRFGDYLETNWKINPVLFRCLIFLSSTSLLLLAVALSNLSRRFASRPVEVQPQDLEDTTFRGLIVIASIGPTGVKSAAHAAIEHHWKNGNGKLEHCWIICGGKNSLDKACDTLTDLLGVRSDNSNVVEYTLIALHDPKRQLRVSLRNIEPPKTDDPNATFQLVNSIYEEAESEGIPSEEMIADYTGGTKSMTAGMILACADPDRLLAFMKPGAYTPDGRADTSKPSIATEVKVDFQVKSVRRPRA